MDWNGGNEELLENGIEGMLTEKDGEEDQTEGFDVELLQAGDEKMLLETEGLYSEQFHY